MSLKKTTKDYCEITRIIYLVEPKIINSPFDYAVLCLFKSLYVYSEKETSLNAIQNIIDFKKQFKNEPLMKEVVIETVKTTCKNINNYNLYKQFIENFQ